jgi:hypothetical protein
MEGMKKEGRKERRKEGRKKESLKIHSILVLVTLKLAWLIAILRKLQDKAN